ncbi:fimbrillin family protein [Phocaeicola sp.]
MKALNKIWIAAIAAASMTACSNELNEQALNNGGNVNFTMGIGNTPSSRISMTEDSYTASFTGNDEVGIFVAEVPSYTNVKYSTADGTTWTGGPVKVSADAAYTYYAYYPYAEGMTANNIPVVVATNQDTEGYIKNDYLYSKLSATAGQTDVKLAFDHALSLIEVTLAGSGAAEGATVDLLNVATDATIDLTAETPVTTGSTTATVTMDALSNLKYRAIVPAQKIAASTPVFKIAVNGRTYQAKYSGEINFEQGKYLAMTITLGEQGGDAEIEITASASINNWTEGTSNGDASISVAELNIPLPVDVKLDTIKYNWSASTSANQIGTDKKEGWYKRSGSSVTNLTVVGYDESEGAMTIKRFANSSGAWNSDNITYHSCSPFEIGQYELSFDLKGATVEGNVDDEDKPIYGTVGVGISVSGDSALFRIPIIANGDYGRTLTTKAATSEYVTVTTKFNFDEISTETKSSGLQQQNFTKATVKNVNKGVNIIFYSNRVTITTPSILYIRNIKLTKVEE